MLTQAAHVLGCSIIVLSKVLIYDIRIEFENDFLYPVGKSCASSG